MRLVGVVLGALVLVGQPSASVAIDTLLGAFEKVCLATGAEYDTVVLKMTSPEWKADVPGDVDYSLFSKVTRWIPEHFTDAGTAPSEAEVQRSYDIPGEGLLMGMTAALTADPGKMGIVSSCTVWGVVEPKSLNRAVAGWAYHPTQDPDIWVLESDYASQITIKREQGIGTILHLYRIAK